MTEISLRNYLKKVDTLIENDALDEATAHSRHILKRYPKNIAAYRHLGRILVIQKRWREAGEIYRRILAAYPSDFTAHSQLSTIHAELRELDDALWHIERAFEQQPNDAAVLARLRQLYSARRGQPVERIPLTDGAVANQYIRSGLYTQAIETLQRAINRMTDRVDLRLQLAQALWNDGQQVEAAETAIEVLDVLPYAVEANRMLAELWLQEKRPSDAQRYLSRIEAVSPYQAIRIATGKNAPADAFKLPELDYRQYAQHELSVTNPEWLESLTDIDLSDVDMQDMGETESNRDDGDFVNDWADLQDATPANIDADLEGDDLDDLFNDLEFDEPDAQEMSPDVLNDAYTEDDDDIDFASLFDEDGDDDFAEFADDTLPDLSDSGDETERPKEVDDSFQLPDGLSPEVIERLNKMRAISADETVAAPMEQPDDVADLLDALDESEQNIDPPPLAAQGSGLTGLLHTIGNTDDLDFEDEDTDSWLQEVEAGEFDILDSNVDMDLPDFPSMDEPAVAQSTEPDDTGISADDDWLQRLETGDLDNTLPQVDFDLSSMAKDDDWQADRDWQAGLPDDASDTDAELAQLLDNMETGDTIDEDEGFGDTFDWMDDDVVDTSLPMPPDDEQADDAFDFAAFDTGVQDDSEDAGAEDTDAEDADMEDPLAWLQEENIEADELTADDDSTFDTLLDDDDIALSDDESVDPLAWLAQEDVELLDEDEQVDFVDSILGDEFSDTPSGGDERTEDPNAWMSDSGIELIDQPLTNEFMTFDNDDMIGDEDDLFATLQDNDLDENLDEDTPDTSEDALERDPLAWLQDSGIELVDEDSETPPAPIGKGDTNEALDWLSDDTLDTAYEEMLEFEALTDDTPLDPAPTELDDTTGQPTMTDDPNNWMNDNQADDDQMKDAFDWLSDDADEDDDDFAFDFDDTDTTADDEEISAEEADTAFSFDMAQSGTVNDGDTDDDDWMQEINNTAELMQSLNEEDWDSGDWEDELAELDETEPETPPAEESLDDLFASATASEAIADADVDWLNELGGMESPSESDTEADDTPDWMRNLESDGEPVASSDDWLTTLDDDLDADDDLEQETDPIAGFAGLDATDETDNELDWMSLEEDDTALTDDQPLQEDESFDWVTSFDGDEDDFAETDDELAETGSSLTSGMTGLLSNIQASRQDDQQSDFDEAEPEEELDFDAMFDEGATIGDEGEPDWLTNLDDDESDIAETDFAPAASDDMADDNDWLSGFGSDEPAASDEPDWLADIQLEADAAEAETAGDDLPLNQGFGDDFEQDDAAFAAEFAGDDFDDDETSVPDWLGNLNVSDDGDIEGMETPAEEDEIDLFGQEADLSDDVVAEGEPDWLTDVGQRDSAGVDEMAFEDEAEPVAQELDWLSEIDENTLDESDAFDELEETPEPDVADLSEGEMVGATVAATTFDEQDDLDEAIMPSAADNAPDWLNAMVPGLDVDYSAEEDEPIEQEYVERASHRQRTLASEGAESFAWLTAIVDEELGTQERKQPEELPPLPPVGTPPPPPPVLRFRFSKPPIWMRRETLADSNGNPEDETGGGGIAEAVVASTAAAAAASAINREADHTSADAIDDTDAITDAIMDDGSFDDDFLNFGDDDETSDSEVTDSTYFNDETDDITTQNELPDYLKMDFDDDFDDFGMDDTTIADATGPSSEDSKDDDFEFDNFDFDDFDDFDDD